VAILPKAQPQQSRWDKFVSGTKSTVDTLKAKPEQSKGSKALGTAAMAEPELLPVAMVAKKAEKYDPAKKASAVLKAARGKLVQRYGVMAITKPRYWILTIMRITTSHPFVIAITALVAGFILLAYTFGNISIFYEFYFLKSSVALIPNMFISIANSIWYSVHGIYYLVVVAFLDVINGIFYFFLSPIVNFLHTVFGWIPYLGQYVPSWDSIKLGGDFVIRYNPQNAFAYLAPTPIKVVGTSGHIDLFGTFVGMWGFAWMKPGSQFYARDANGNLEKEFFYSENGATLFFPKLNPDAISTGFWAKVIDGPPPRGYTFDTDNVRNWWDMLTGTTPYPQSGQPTNIWSWDYWVYYFTHFTFNGG